MFDGGAGHNNVKGGKKFHLVEVAANEGDSRNLIGDGGVEIHRSDVIALRRHGRDDGRFTTPDLKGFLFPVGQVNADPAPIKNLLATQVEASLGRTRLATQ